MEDECDLMASNLVCFASKSGRVSRKMTSTLTLFMKKRFILVVVANALPLVLQNINDENVITPIH